jgi:hypothetical protein
MHRDHRILRLRREGEHPSPGVSMRKAYEIVMVIVAAALAAAVAVIDVPGDSADPGTVIGGEELFAAPPPASAPIFPPLPPSLVPPGSSAPVPTDPLGTPASAVPFGVQPPRGVTKASSPAVRVLGTTSVRHAPTAATDPPAVRPKPPPIKPPTRTKPKASRKTASAGSSPRSIGPTADDARAATGRWAGHSRPNVGLARVQGT